MNRCFWIVGMMLAMILISFGTGLTSEQKLPVVNGKKVVAIINDELITLEEFTRELASLTSGEEKQNGKAAKQKLELLKRLTDSRLILQEARKIGLNELSEIKNMVDPFSRIALREQLMEDFVKDIKVNEKEIEKTYKELVQEWKVSSLLFEKEEEANKTRDALSSGKDFDAAAKKAIEQGIAKGGGENKYLKKQEFHPQMLTVILKMKVGSISPVIAIQSGFLILKIQEIRYPENPEAKERAKKDTLHWKRVKSLNDYKSGLVKKYTKFHQKIVDQLDFEAKEPGFEALLKDKRVIAEMRGEEPVTVGDLAEALKQQFYHGVEKAIESKRLNKKKNQVFTELVEKRVLRKEALRKGIDKSAAYQNKVKDYENSLIFGSFLQKVIIPDIKFTEEELKSYYRDHITEYTYPEMVKIDGLVYSKRNIAEKAIENLRRGTNLEWLKANTEAQVSRDTKGVLTFDDKLVVKHALPEEVQKVLSGAFPGETRFYESPQSHFYVLYVKDVIPSKPQPFEEVKQKIAQKVFDEKLNQAVKIYVDKLRAVSDIKVYLKEN